MANKIHVYKDSDIKRALRASKAEGYTPTGVEVHVKTGIVRVFFGNGATQQTEGNNVDVVR
jgi:ribosomal protein L35AE/L33A